jgi:thioredoxin-related protein
VEGMFLKRTNVKPIFSEDSMNLLVSLLFISLFGLGLSWENDFNIAKKEASAKDRYILINFSGSDWCASCIKMHKEVFDSDVFKDYSSANLVLINADFPRSKKNQLDEAQAQRNEQLASQYNRYGKFPYTILTDAEGKILKTWEGLPDKSVEQFVNDIKLSIHKADQINLASVRINR